MTTLRKQIALSAATAALAVLATPSVANAAPVSTTAAVAVPSLTAALAPSCVTFKAESWKSRLIITNGCYTTERVKVIIQSGPDSSCQVLGPGHIYTFYNYSLRVDRLEKC